MIPLAISVQLEPLFSRSTTVALATNSLSAGLNTFTVIVVSFLQEIINVITNNNIKATIFERITN